MRKLIFSMLMLMIGVGGFAQIRGPIANPAPGVLDGVYVKEHIPTKKVIPYEYVREADVTWSKRIWRVLDMREKFNHPLYYPLDEVDPDALPDGYPNSQTVIATTFSPEVWRRNPTRWSLWTIIRYHIMTGDLTMYSPFNPEWIAWKDGDMFKYPYTAARYGTTPNGTFITDSVYRENLKGMEYLGKLVLKVPPEPVLSIAFPGEDSLDSDGNTVYYPDDFIWYSGTDIVQYRIKEDWFFDNERSVLDVRIIGICPVIYARNSDGDITGFKELFWLYFPECRYVFQNFFVQNRNNDSQRMSFDDLFWKRMFQSYIYKETNLYDREINSYKAGVDALLESEKIKEKITLFEHDLWSL